MADDLAVAQVDKQADVVPAVADAHVGQVAAHVGARRVPAELPGDHVRQVGLVGPSGMVFEPLAAICAGQAVLPHYPADAPAVGGYAVPGERRLDLAGPVAPAVGLVRRQHGGLDGVGPPGRPARPHGVVGRARNAEDLSSRRYRVAVVLAAIAVTFVRISAPLVFKASTFMRSLRFSRSSSITRFCSGVRLSAACGDPAALIDLTHLSTALFDRPHSRIASASGFPAFTSSTICR